MGLAACKYMVDRLFEEGRYVQIVDELTDYNYKRIASICEDSFITNIIDSIDDITEAEQMSFSDSEIYRNFPDEYIVLNLPFE